MPEETARWKEIIEKMYLPGRQRMGYFEKTMLSGQKVLGTVDDIPSTNGRSTSTRVVGPDSALVFTSSKRLLLGLFLYYEHFDRETIRRNFRFYEPRTVHESSLSPFVHAILAAWIGDTEEAYRLFLHSTRLDLDDYNNEVHQGLHVTSMAGSWQIIVRGFAGMKILDGQLDFTPIIPEAWDSYTFKVNFRNCTLQMKVGKQEIKISLLEGYELNIRISEVVYNLKKGKDLIVPKQN